jgi:hypothetical protein
MALLLCLTSCGEDDPVGPVDDALTVAVEKSEYAPGETIHMTATNNSGTSLDLDTCVALQGFSSAEGWLPLFHCPITNETQITTVQPGHRVDLSYVLGAAQPSGKYRASVVVVGDSESGQPSASAYFSGSFQIVTDGGSP